MIFPFPSTCLLKSLTALGDDLTGSVLNNFTLEPFANSWPKNTQAKQTPQSMLGE